MYLVKRLPKAPVTSEDSTETSACIHSFPFSICNLKSSCISNICVYMLLFIYQYVVIYISVY